MADRPGTPGLERTLNDFARRLRALEKIRPGFVPPEAESLIEVWDEGVSQGLVHTIDFTGNGIATYLKGDKYAQVDVPGAAVTFDAILDSLLVASDPPNRLFKTNVGEAAGYLKSIGLTRALILVRPGTYTETANWTSPEGVILFGAAPGTGFSASGTGRAIWNTNGFAGTCSSGNGPEYTVYNIYHRPATGAISQTNQSYVAFNCGFDHQTNANAATFIYGTHVFLDNCYVNNMVRMGTHLIASNTDMRARGGSNATFGTTFIARNCRVAGSGGSGANPTWALAAITDIELDEVQTLRGDSVSVGGTFNLTTGNSAYIRVRWNPQGSTSTSGVFTHTGGDLAHLDLQGVFSSFSTDGAHGFIRARSAGACTISGGAAGGLNVDIIAERTVTITGNVVGKIYVVYVLSSGTALNFVNSDKSVITASVVLAVASSTQKAYAFDAASDRNFLIIESTNGFPTASTDAGTNNIVLPDAIPAGGMAPANADYLVGTANAGLSAEIVVGTTPGGELGNTWAAPTVDALHSGSQHTDFIAKAFFGAKGDLIAASANDTPFLLAVGANGTVLVADSTQTGGLIWRTLTTADISGYLAGHVIEEEGSALTQRANMNFVGAGVTATDAGGKTVVTIPATAIIDGHVIEDEGTPLTQRANMNFVGGGVTATDAGGKTVVTIPSGVESFATISKWTD